MSTRALVLFSLTAMLVCTVSTLVRAQVTQQYMEEARGELTQCQAQLHDAKERLTEVDCRAPLNPRLPFGGMGIWRATYCPGNQP